MSEKSKTPLSDRQALFVARYLVHFNATRAAREAGYSPGRAAQTASTLRATPAVAEAIAAGRSDLRNATRELQGAALGTLAAVIQSDIGRQFEKGTWTAKTLDQLDPEDRLAIASVTIKTYEGGQSITLKLANRLDAVKQLRKMLAMDLLPDDGDLESDAIREAAESLKLKLDEIRAARAKSQARLVIVPDRQETA